jgi:hypothetical protein
MEFSDTYKHSGHCIFSPDARFLAVAVDYRLVIRDITSLKVRRFFFLEANESSSSRQSFGSVVFEYWI